MCADLTLLKIVNTRVKCTYSDFQSEAHHFKLQKFLLSSSQKETSCNCK